MISINAFYHGQFALRLFLINEFAIAIKFKFRLTRVSEHNRIGINLKNRMNEIYVFLNEI